MSSLALSSTLLLFCPYNWWKSSRFGVANRQLCENRTKRVDEWSKLLSSPPYTLLFLFLVHSILIFCRHDVWNKWWVPYLNFDPCCMCSVTSQDVSDIIRANTGKWVCTIASARYFLQQLEAVCIHPPQITWIYGWYQYPLYVSFTIYESYLMCFFHVDKWMVSSSFRY